MAEYRDPFETFGRGGQYYYQSWGDDGNNSFQEFHFNSAEEARDFFEGRGRQQRRRQKHELKTHFFQGYKDVFPGRWIEISKDELNKDAGKLPKGIDAPFFYVIKKNRNYYIDACYAAIIFYDHQNNDFIYMRSDGSLLSEKNIFKTPDEAYDRLMEMLTRYTGATVSITFQDGHTSKLDEPLWPSDMKKQGETK